MSSVPQDVIKHKVGLLHLAAELGNVSRACKVMEVFPRYLLSLCSTSATPLVRESETAQVIPAKAGTKKALI